MLDDLRQLSADFLDFLHAASHFLGELVHAHHAGGNGRLDVLDHLLDVVSGHGRLVREPPDLGRDDREAPPVLPGLLGLDRCIEGQQIGLVGDLRYRRDHLIDGCGLFIQH